MRRLLPGPVSDARDPHADLAYTPMWVAVGMVASLDGAATDGKGVSGGLGGDGDKRSFRSLRAAADVILVGAGTARTERYGPVRLTGDQQAARSARGQAAEPAMAVVTRSLDLEGAEAMWEDGRAPLVITTDAADPDRVAELEGRGSHVVSAGTGDVDAAEAVAALRRRGWGRVLCEGGPAITGWLLAAGLVEHIVVTVAPALIGGDAGRIVRAPALGMDLDLASVHEEDGDVVLHYVVHNSAMT